MSLVEKYLGKVIAKNPCYGQKDNERWILITEIDKEGKWGYPIVAGTLIKKEKSTFTNKVGEKTWSYVDDIERIVTTEEVRALQSLRDVREK